MLPATGWYAYREWYPELFYNFQAITYFYHGDYAASAERFGRLLAINPDLVNGYAYRSRAYIELGDFAAALPDLDRIIGSGQGIAADYMFRAVAYHGLGDRDAGCADLRTALDARRWPLGPEERARVTADYWRGWGCP
jgi:tetratricopeptide (TPR) repeat protein